jgi:hypothetical protein
LFSFRDESPTRRKGDGKIKANLIDIIDLFHKLDEAKVCRPKFLSDSYAGMPPVSGFEVIADHIGDLMTEIASLKMKYVN